MATTRDEAIDFIVNRARTELFRVTKYVPSSTEYRVKGWARHELSRIEMDHILEVEATWKKIYKNIKTVFSVKRSSVVFYFRNLFHGKKWIHIHMLMHQCYSHIILFLLFWIWQMRWSPIC